MVLSPSVARDHSRWRTKRRPTAAVSSAENFAKFYFPPGQQEPKSNFAKISGESYPRQGLAAKAGGRLYERHKREWFGATEGAKTVMAARSGATDIGRVPFERSTTIPVDILPARSRLLQAHDARPCPHQSLHRSARSTRRLHTATWKLRYNTSMVLFAPVSDAPSVFGASPKQPILQWDFSRQMDSDIAVDISGAGRHGRLVNRPSRAVLGPAWDKKTIRWTDDPAQWDALHLHDDDLDDVQWSTDFEIEAPAESGIYAVRLNQGETSYYIPFYVRPGAVRKRVLFVAPTNTYLAYGNEHLWEGERGIAHQKMMSFPIVLDKAETLLQQMPSLGRSLYDRHSDDSGVIYASRLRPLTNMQPNYINWLAGGPRHFSGDFFITGWLDSIGIEFDVATDEDVDILGKSLLDAYDVVLTGSHPEYPTVAEFDAFEDYVKGGGKLMYLGANGFFWVTSYVNKLRTAIEVRRGYAAQRNWTSHAAELYHSSTGEMGGAYRHRGRDQNPFLGVGMAAAGWGPASGFTRTPESYAEAVAWVFEGIASETIGEHGYLLGGAAGDELDHADPARGTPDSTVVLMSSRHNDLFFPSLDSVTEVAPNQQGSKNPHVRADVVLVEHPGGGKVFSTGSICWAGSLGTNSYDNDIARLTTNVLRKFLAE
ncbi:N,N-dimethylformamidase beta subunit family domain-containing protein [Mesorhizobium sp.]|uniref:N,N-dimethylformamidase beta subunit family domain-containing protein n=1 Tax=Mesorhizobium sp. TaxID=1871066 RepID=UPI0034517E4F